MIAQPSSHSFPYNASANVDIKPSFPEKRIKECRLDPLSLVHTGYQGLFDMTIEGISSIGELKKKTVSIDEGFGFPAHLFYQSLTLLAVQLLLEIHPKASVLITGHSLGGAVSVFDLVYLKCHLPETTEVDAIVFGAPRTVSHLKERLTSCYFLIY